MDIIIKDISEKQANAIQDLMPEKIISEINEGIISIKSYINLSKPKLNERYYFLVVQKHSYEKSFTKSIEIHSSKWSDNEFDNKLYADKNVFLNWDFASGVRTFIFMFLERLK